MLASSALYILCENLPSLSSAHGYKGKTMETSKSHWYSFQSSYLACIEVTSYLHNHLIIFIRCLVTRDYNFCTCQVLKLVYLQIDSRSQKILSRYPTTLTIILWETSSSRLSLKKRNPLPEIIFVQHRALCNRSLLCVWHKLAPSSLCL